MEEYKKYDFLSWDAWNFPQIVNVNVLSGACPCRCIHCPVGLVSPEERGLLFRNGQMEIFLFMKIVDEIAKESEDAVLRIHSVGEPILWTKLVDAIKYAKNRKVKTWIFTSAVTRDKDLLMQLCEHVDIIEVSVNSISKEDYLETKGVDEYELVKSNIYFMNEYIKENNLSTRLICSRVQTKSEADDTVFLNYWKQTGILSDVFIRSYHNYNGILGQEENNTNAITPCLVHWGRFNIDINGDVVICFNELFKKQIKKDYILGNVLNERIAIIWKSKKMNNIRLFQVQKKQHLDVDIPCKGCTTCQKYPPHPDTSEKQIRKLGAVKYENIID